jgi:3-deoxy-7-phosphoheptulonate synthase
MLESNLREGRQNCTGCFDTLRYGVSITDACIDWETTEELILSAHERLRRPHRLIDRKTEATATAGPSA